MDQRFEQESVTGAPCHAVPRLTLDDVVCCIRDLSRPRQSDEASFSLGLIGGFFSGAVFEHTVLCGHPAKAQEQSELLRVYVDKDCIVPPGLNLVRLIIVTVAPSLESVRQAYCRETAEGFIVLRMEKGAPPNTPLTPATNPV